MANDNSLIAHQDEDTTALEHLGGEFRGSAEGNREELSFTSIDYGGTIFDNCLPLRVQVDGVAVGYILSASRRSIVTFVIFRALLTCVKGWQLGCQIDLAS